MPWIAVVTSIILVVIWVWCLVNTEKIQKECEFYAPTLLGIVLLVCALGYGIGASLAHVTPRYQELGVGEFTYTIGKECVVVEAFDLEPLVSTDLHVYLEAKNDNLKKAYIKREINEWGYTVRKAITLEK